MSGNVVPATGDVQFLSNASSNAVCQVFGLGSNSSFSSLVGRPYNPSVTSAPVFTAPTVPSFPLSLQRDLSGASMFIDTPNNPTLSGFNVGNQQIYPNYSGPTGPALRYYIALGTSPGTINTVSWRDVSINTWNNLPANTFTLDVKYYLSAVLSNINNGRKSLAISNSTTIYGQPNPPSTVTLTITSSSSWSITWTESSTVTIPTTYYWHLYKSDFSALITNGTELPNVRSVSGTTLLAYDTDYIAIVVGQYSISSSERQSSAKRVPALAAPVLTDFTNLPLRNTETVTANWGAVTNATGYRILINDVFIEDITTNSYSIALTSYTNSVKTFKVRSKDGSHLGGTSTGLQFFYNRTAINAWTNVTFNNNAIYLLRAIGGGGGDASSIADGDLFTTNTSGGAGGITTVTTKSARTSFDYLIGAGGGDPGGANPGPGGNGRLFVNYFVYSGGGGGYTAINFPGGPSIPVWAGGGGGCGGGTLNLGITGGQTGKKVAGVHARGGMGGSGNSDNGGATGGAGTNSSANSLKVNNGRVNVFSYSGDPGGLFGPGIVPNATSNVNIGGTVEYTGSPYLMTSDYGERISYPPEIASFRPTSGNANAGGTGARIYWFAGACGGGGGAGYFGGSGGHAYVVATGNETAAADQYKSIAVGAGGGGGSGYADTTYVTKFGTSVTNLFESQGSSGQDGSIFIAQRV